MTPPCVTKACCGCSQRATGAYTHAKALRCRSGHLASAPSNVSARATRVFRDRAAERGAAREGQHQERGPARDETQGRMSKHATAPAERAPAKRARVHAKE
jgi:hypothetical protein